MEVGELTLYRPILLSIAYKLTKNVIVAEDMVQDTFLNCLKVDHQKIQNTKAYLIRSVTNACFNYLDSLKRKKEDLFENFSPVFSELKFIPDFSNIDIKSELKEAIIQLYKKLLPTERAVFVLKEVFNFDYSDLPNIIGKKVDNCRQLYCRAQQKLSKKKEISIVDTDNILQIMEDFKSASLGEFSNLIERFKKEINK